MILAPLFLSTLLFQAPAKPIAQPAPDPVPQETVPTLDKLKTDYADCSVTLNSKLFYVEVLKKTIRDQAAEIAKLNDELKKKSNSTPTPTNADQTVNRKP